MRFFRHVSPTGAVQDLWRQLGPETPHRWLFMGLSALVTVGLFSVMWQEESQGLPPPPEVIFVESWRADRGDAEIIAGNIAAQKVKEERLAAEAASAERIRQMYKALGRASGMDVDAIEREARAEQEAEKAKANAARAAAPAP